MAFPHYDPSASLRQGHQAPGCLRPMRFLKPNFHWVRQRRVTAAPRSPELIGNTIINESISTGKVSAACQQRLSSGSRAAALSIGSISIFDGAVANSRQAQQSRLHQTGSPTLNRHNKTSVFQNKTTRAASRSYFSNKQE